jgi:hypothetical protein
MSTRQEILNKTKIIKDQSKAYRFSCVAEEVQYVDEMGGHVGFAEKEKVNSLCPSIEYVNGLLRKCAGELGVDYNNK